ncbi:hypothetical protein NDU88_008853 [Pleurodeles waltl]|uniref:Uncharacterized protein n=1 Tax=Pleurodeles waltl TaxID=8319 RepID=A0AAV7RV08_PLEWA|nr:hypothetical protein NDU88_008853 [Pleurodeles waltl]
MEVEAKVMEAVALLRQVGRMDLLKDGALAPGRPACRASAGVAAAVATCSPPRVAGAFKVREASLGAGAKGGFGADKGRFFWAGAWSGIPEGFPGGGTRYTASELETSSEGEGGAAGGSAAQRGQSQRSRGARGERHGNI